MEHELLMTLAADIVSAHVSNNTINANEVPGLISSVYKSLAGLGLPVTEEEVRPEPVVTVRASVKPDAITCLECGYKGKMLKRHLSSAHSLNTDEYRKRWDLPRDYPMVAPDYAETRKALAVKIGLGRKSGQGKKSGRPKKAKPVA
jgi:predicted transcriptional regulator